mmetsp:Transcript_81578/g.205265  ORF Transcript_81578/g.205265 Transcript_81578/m.205265 type:complete len:201 (+) Transcript_81578:304-906(+)
MHVRARAEALATNWPSKSAWRPMYVCVCVCVAATPPNPNAGGERTPWGMVQAGHGLPLEYCSMILQKFQAFLVAMLRGVLRGGVAVHTSEVDLRPLLQGFCDSGHIAALGTLHEEALRRGFHLLQLQPANDLLVGLDRLLVVLILLLPPLLCKIECVSPELGQRFEVGAQLAQQLQGAQLAGTSGEVDCGPTISVGGFQV